jgi:hypothetical protein
MIPFVINLDELVKSMRSLKNAQFCSSSRKAKILTTPYDLPDLRGRHEYIEYFED